MRFFNSERMEYIKQPHILALIVLMVAVVIGVAITAVMRISDMQRISKLETEESCNEFIEDSELCKFIAMSEQDSQANYSMVSQTETENGPETTTIEVESSNRIKSTVSANGKEVDSYIVIDDTTYVKDYSDNVWAMYTDSEYTPEEVEKTAYDFSSSTSNDVIYLRNNYKQVGQEDCGDLVCLKYEILPEGDDQGADFIWFDTKDYRLRRHISIDQANTTDTSFSYGLIKITAPQPTKVITEEELEEYL